MADPSEDQPEESDQDRNWRKLEERAKNAEERAAQLERQVAFTEAGLSDLSDKQVKALVATHEGEMTAEALKATATDLGFVKVETETPATVDPVQAQRDQEVAALAQFSGAPAPVQTPGPSADLQQSIKDFKGDYQEFAKFVLANADSILEK